MNGPNFEQLHALIIEDNGHMLTLLHTLVRSIGIKHIIEAPDGTRGLVAAKEQNPDFVITDLNMQPMDGIAFTRQVRGGSNGINPYLPIIMVTGHTEYARVIEARDAGVNEFLAKPINVGNLHSRIVQIIERPRPFVRSDRYFGPDRRRRKDPLYVGPFRRQSDTSEEVALR
jgi:DNA-binding response OmpR family regulator